MDGQDADDLDVYLVRRPPRDVHRALAHFELSSEQQVI